MKNWISDHLPGVIITIVIIAAILSIAYFVVEDINARKACRAAGYVERAIIRGTHYCIGYTDGNQLIAVRYDEVKQ